MPTQFEPNPNFETELTHEPQFEKGMRTVAERIQAYATRFDETVEAPWMPRKGLRPFEIRTVDHVTYVVNTDYAAVITEFGGYHNPPYAPLRRAVRAAGLKLAEAPKGAPRLSL